MDLENKAQIAKELTLGVINKMPSIPENWEVMGRQISNLFAIILKGVTETIDAYTSSSARGLSDEEIENRLIDTHQPCDICKFLK
jgi:hypothetical protein